MVYWVELASKGRLGIAPRPRGGDWLDTELNHLRREGVDILVSMLPENEAAELGLAGEAEACIAAGVEFRNYPIPDRHTPTSTESFRRFIEQLHQDHLAGKSIAAHCRAGIGRSSLLIASLMRRTGIPAEEAFRRISLARGLQVPDTQEQVEWVEQLTLEP